MKSYNIEDLFNLKWSELTTKEHAAIIYYADCLKKIRSEESRNYQLEGHYSILILKTLRKNKSAVSKITVEQVVDCVNDIHFINEPWYHLPKIKNGLQADDHLKHHTFGMLCRMDSLFSKWLMQQHNVHHLQNQLLGIIYTTPDEYDERKIEEKGIAIAKIIKQNERFVATATYANIRKFIIDGCPTLFPQPEENEESQEPHKKEASLIDTEPMWEKLLFILAETQAYPGVGKAKAAPMYEALNYLEAKAIASENSKTKPKGQS